MSAEENNPIEKDIISEDIPALQEQESISEDIPAYGHGGVTEVPSHEKTQGFLGKTILIATLIAYSLVIIGYVFDPWGAASRLSDGFNFAISGIQTLAAAVVGFYFGSKK